MKKLINGPCGNDIGKVYRVQGSSFIRIVSINSFHTQDSIYNLQDNETVQNGIFREWDTECDSIGSQYYRRSGSEDRNYCLVRGNNGNISYNTSLWTIINGECMGWGTSKLYSFNPETLDWIEYKH